MYRINLTSGALIVVRGGRVFPRENGMLTWSTIKRSLFSFAMMNPRLNCSGNMKDHLSCLTTCLTSLECALLFLYNLIVCFPYNTEV